MHVFICVRLWCIYIPHIYVFVLKHRFIMKILSNIITFKLDGDIITSLMLAVSADCTLEASFLVRLRFLAGASCRISVENVKDENT